MSRSMLKNVGTGLSVLCFVLLFVAVERYQANAASVAAMNQMLQNSPFGPNSPLGINTPFGMNSPLGQGAQMTPGVPAITTYAVLFAALSAAGALTCFVKAKARSATV